jgi:hypothetical protein
MGLGFDRLPEHVLRSQVLSANNLGQLANSEGMPTVEEARDFLGKHERGEANEEAFWRFERSGDYRAMLGCALALRDHADRLRAHFFFEHVAKAALAHEDVVLAWNVLIAAPLASEAPR